jgi:hypothetical protein
VGGRLFIRAIFVEPVPCSFWKEVVMIHLVLALTLATFIPQEGSQEKPRIPKDSVEVVVIGCLTGRALKASEVRQYDVQSGPIVAGRTFRVAAKGEVMDEIKKQDGHLVEAVGIVKRSALDDKGVKVTRGIEVNGGSPVSRTGIPSGTENVPVMDVSSIRQRASACGSDSRD